MDMYKESSDHISETTPLRQKSTMKSPWCGCQIGSNGRKFLVDFLAVCFGIGSWIGINGMFVQLPLLVQSQPEGWNLPSYLTVIIQVANVGPILYSISRGVCKGRIRDSWIVYTVLALGTTALLLLAFLYQRTSVVGGAETSTALLALVFFVALVGCTSSVLFMPYMGRFRDIYLVSYFVGEGLSGFLPSVVALGQGVGGNPTCVNVTTPDGNSSLVPVTPQPHFSTQVFFLFLFATLALSTVAFFLLNNLRVCNKERVTPDKHNAGKASTSTSMEQVSDSHAESSRPDGDMSATSSEESLVSIPMTRSLTGYLLAVEAWVCLLGNGVFPAIQSYACLPYGNVVYHLSATLGSMANPVACFLAFFVPTSSIAAISVLTVLSTIVSGYLAAAALTSPVPPLVGTTAGEAIMVACWIVNTGLISYVKLSVATLFRREVGRALFWCGAVQQMGSAVGAVTTFFLVNYTPLFVSYYPCQG